MITETKRIIHFTEYIPKKGREKDTDSPPFVNANVKNGRIVFGKKALNKLSIDGKFLKFYFEPTKKIIGWTVTDKLDEYQLQSKAYRLVKLLPSGVYVASLEGIFKEIQKHGLDKMTYKLEVKKYVEREGSILDRGTTYYYIKFSDSVNNEEDED